MSSKNQTAKPAAAAPAASKPAASPQLPTPAAVNPPTPQLTEVDPSKGLTPEQLQVAASLSMTIDPKSAEAKKERHPDRLRKSEVASPVKTVIAYVIARKAEVPTITRKQLVDELVSKGIAFYTARTQVQTALKAMKPQSAPTAKAS